MVAGPPLLAEWWDSIASSGDHFRGKRLLPYLLVVHLFHELGVALLKLLQKSLFRSTSSEEASRVAAATSRSTAELGATEGDGSLFSPSAKDQKLILRSSRLQQVLVADQECGHQLHQLLHID